MYRKHLNLNYQNCGINSRLTALRTNFSRQYVAVAMPAIKYVAFIAVFLLLSACSRESGELNQTVGADVVIATSSANIYLSGVGGQYAVSATLVDDQGVAFVDQPAFVWESASAGVVSVDANGVVTANGLGQSVVTVRANGLSSQIQVLVSDQAVVLNGTVRYEDREYGRNGFVDQPDYFKAVRFAKVTVVDNNGAEVGGIGSVYTDENGNFTLSGLLDSQHFVRVSAATDNSLGLDLAVKDRQQALYSVTKQVDITQAANFMMDVPLSSEASGAFNILDVFTSSAEFTLLYTDLSLVSLNTFWEVNNTDGTYFCNDYDAVYCDSGKGVYVYGVANGDTDEYDDDVLYHEFAHYFTQAVSRDDSYGGCHVLSSTDLDLRLAWSEGWGDFFPSAMKTWLAADPSRSGLISSSPGYSLAGYVDTYQSRAQISVEIDSLSPSVYKSAANELAIAKILYLLNQRYGMEPIIDVFTGYFPGVATPVNLESFWDGWLAIHSPTVSDKAQLTGFYNERSIYYQEDRFEPDNNMNPARKIALNTAETHYLYSETVETDIDFVAFDTVAGNQYSLSTANLTSGADTYIRVFSPDGTELNLGGVTVENDDANETAYYGYDSACGSSRVKNNTTALSSSLSFIAPITGTYYAELRTTTDPDPYLSAGRYGTFSFKVIQN